MPITAIAEPACPPAPVRGRAAKQLGIEAAKARSFGKVFVAAVLESVARTLQQAPCLAHAIETWPADLASAGVIFRLNAGLHAMARSGRHPDLAAIYCDARADTAPDQLLLDFTLARVLRDSERDLLQWMCGPTQTNEVARVAALAAVLLELDAHAPMRTSVLELGSSAGLNLNFEHYDIHMGSQRYGSLSSEVCIAPRWTGRAPLPGLTRISSAKGVDLNPLDVRHEADSERLHAYIWPGERARSERLRAAIALARLHPPQVDKGRAGEWLQQQLALPQLPGERRVVFHSMVAQYLPETERRMIDRMLGQAGRAATASTPLVRIGLEWNAGRTEVQVSVTQWHGQPGPALHAIVAECHPYAEWFAWAGL
ncbi:DUF2332 family protein [Novosphingobium jiangmenense]|uniref:DUF2332 family protein n=1 Tax=Novosphingobium jiangmenense TaxID=2791981 RepID=A0ABS0HJV0_9SPHN|nr:DUF2332 family protein [Novosphingobium jiangmenense]MBF9152259.1 DUF2332 family protein [Novosphingobium jiangmenense]